MNEWYNDEVLGCAFDLLVAAYQKRENSWFRLAFLLLALYPINSSLIAQLKLLKLLPETRKIRVSFGFRVVGSLFNQQFLQQRPLARLSPNPNGVGVWLFDWPMHVMDRIGILDFGQLIPTTNAKDLSLLFRIRKRQSIARNESIFRHSQYVVKTRISPPALFQYS